MLHLQGPQMLGEGNQVLISMQGFDQHVIYVDLYCVAKVVCEHLINQSLVGCTCIFKAERHDLINTIFS